jgi:hypothetical protein
VNQGRTFFCPPWLCLAVAQLTPLMSVCKPHKHAQQAQSSSRTLSAAAADPAASSASSPGDACAANPAVPTPWLPLLRLRLMALGRPAPLRLCAALLLAFRAGVTGCRPCTDTLSSDQTIVAGCQTTAVPSKMQPAHADSTFSDDDSGHEGEQKPYTLLTAASVAAWLAALRRRAASLSVWHTRVWQARQNHCSPSAVLLQPIWHCSPEMLGVTCKFAQSLHTQPTTGGASTGCVRSHGRHEHHTSHQMSWPAHLFFQKSEAGLRVWHLLHSLCVTAARLRCCTAAGASAGRVSASCRQSCASATAAARCSSAKPSGLSSSLQHDTVNGDRRSCRRGGCSMHPAYSAAPCYVTIQRHFLQSVQLAHPRLRHPYLLMDVATSLKSLRRRDLGLRAASAWPTLARLFAAVCRPALAALDPIACTTGRAAGQVYNT